MSRSRSRSTTWRPGRPATACRPTRIRAVVQTADGFLWLGTEAGLVRFDGLEFRVFDRNSTPALKATDVTALFEDREHQLWIGTDDGSLIRMRGRRVRGDAGAFRQRHHDLLPGSGRHAVGRRRQLRGPRLQQRRGGHPRIGVPVRHRDVDLPGAGRQPAPGHDRGGAARRGRPARRSDGRAEVDPGGGAGHRRHVVGGPAQRPQAHRRRPSRSAVHGRRRSAQPQRHGARPRSSRRAVDRHGGGSRAPGRRSHRRLDRSRSAGRVADGLVADRGPRRHDLGRHARGRPAADARRAVPRHHVASGAGEQRRHLGARGPRRWPVGRHAGCGADAVERQRPLHLDDAGRPAEQRDPGACGDARRRDLGRHLPGLARIQAGRVTSFAGTRRLPEGRRAHDPRGSRRRLVGRDAPGAVAPPRRRAEAVRARRRLPRQGRLGAAPGARRHDLDRHRRQRADPLPSRPVLHLLGQRGAAQQRRQRDPLRRQPERLGRHLRREHCTSSATTACWRCRPRKGCRAATRCRSSTTDAARSGSPASAASRASIART